MKRVLFALAVLACSPTGDSVTTTVDAGGAVTIAPPYPLLVVPRGQTVSLDVTVEIAQPEPQTTITATPPDGVTVSSAIVGASGATHVTLDVTASADAPTGELPMDIRAVVNGSIVASASVLVDVSDASGSLDTTFGNGGFVFFPYAARTPEAIALMQDGTLVVAGTDIQSVFVERFAPTSDVPPSPFHYGAGVIESHVTAVAPDGRVAFSFRDSSEHIVELDAQNQILTNIDGTSASVGFAFDANGGFFIGTPTTVHYAGDNGVADVFTPFVIDSLEALGPDVVRIAGYANGMVFADLMIDGTTFDASPETIVGSSPMAVVNTATTSNGTLVGMYADSTFVVARCDASGNLVSQSTAGKPFDGGRQVVALPDGSPLVVGTSTALMGTRNITTGFVLGFDPAFGTTGHAYVVASDSTTINAAALDPTGKYLYVTGTATGVENDSRGYVARVRITSSP